MRADRQTGSIVRASGASAGPIWGLAAVLLGLLPLQALGQQPPRNQVTLPEAIERALKADPRVVRAQGDRRVAAAAERTAFGNYLPRLTASASSSVAARSGMGLGAGVSVNWDLFTGFRRSAQREQAQAQSSSAEAGLRLDAAQVALTVEQTFYLGLRGRELEEVAQARLKRAQEGLEAAQRKARAGAATRSDVLRAELELNTAQQSLIEARTERENAAFALGRAIGAEAPVEAAAGSSPEDEPLDAEALVTALVQSAPEVVAAEAAVRTAGAGVQVARSGYLPQVGLGAGYDWSAFGAGAPVFPGVTGWSVRLGLSYPIFDGFRREESMERARVQETVASATLADTRRGVRSDAEQLLGTLRLAQQRIALAQKSVEVAAEDLRVQQERYRLGVTTMLDLLASQASVVEAQTNQVGARFDYRLARAELQAMAGRNR